MASLRQRIGVHVLPHLGGQTVSQLPAVTACPCCHTANALRLQQVAGETAVWAWCYRCNVSGDMILVAAEAWKISPVEALCRLQQEGGVPELTDAERDGFAAEEQRRLRLVAFWAECRQRLKNPEKAVISLVDELAVTSPGDRWFTTMSSILGVFTREAATAALWNGCRPGGTVRPDAVGFCLPLYDLPGRLSGFMLLNRQGPPTIWQAGGADPGVAMLPDQTTEHRELGGDVFILPNPLLAAALQSKHAHSSSSRLPVLSVCPPPLDGLSHVWEWLPASRRICWDPDIAVALRVARAVRGCVPSPTAVGDVDKMMQRLSPLESLQRLRAAAVPWQDQLAAYLGRATPHEAERVMTVLSLPLAELDAMADRWTVAARQKLPAGGAVRRIQRVLFEKHWVLETADGWYLEETGECVVNAVIRIDEIIHYGRESFYSGRVILQGETHSFTVPTEKLEDEGLRWLFRWLRDRGQPPRLLQHSLAWSGRVVQLALRFGTPVIRRIPIGGGWDAASGCFRFANFVLDAEGYRTVSLLPTTRDHEQLPSLPPPGQLTMEKVRQLSQRTPGVTAAWSVILRVLQVALAVVRGTGSAPLLWHTCRPHAFVKLLQAVGCPRSTGQRPRTRQWVTWTKLAGHYSEAAIEAASDLVSHPGPSLARSLSHATAWLPVPATAGDDAAINTAAAAVVSTYLQDLCRRELQVPANRADASEALQYDLAAWFARNQGRSELVTVPQLLPIKTAIEQLPAAVRQRVTVKELRWCPVVPKTPRRPDRLAGYGEYAGTPAVWVPTAAFSRGSPESRLSLELLHEAANQLRQAGALLSDAGMQSHAGWWIDVTWWQTCLRRSYDHDDTRVTDQQSLSLPADPAGAGSAGAAGSV